MLEPLDVPMSDIDLDTHSLTGWPRRVEAGCCLFGTLRLLCATHDHASYECDHCWNQVEAKR